MDTRALSQRGPGLARFGIIDDRLSEAPQAHDREAGTIIHELHDGLDVAAGGGVGQSDVGQSDVGPDGVGPDGVGLDGVGEGDRRGLRIADTHLPREAGAG